MGNSGDCTATATCPVPNGFLSTSPSLAGSVIFLTGFAVLIPVNFFVGMRYDTRLYSATIITGLAFEVMGYIGRVLLNSNMASVSNFVVYMLGTIMGPTFITSAIYQILPHIIVLYGKEFTLVSQPAYFRVFFLAFDLFTLAFQAAGVAFAVTGVSQAEMAQGINILLVGLGMQLAGILVFLGSYWYFVYSLHHRRYVLDPAFQEVYLAAKFKIFLLCMQLATVFILARTVARLVSLVGGWANVLNQSQITSLLLDGALMLIACIVLTAVPVGVAFGPAWRSTSPRFMGDHEAPLPLRQRGIRPDIGRPSGQISAPFPTPLSNSYNPRAPPYRPIGPPPVPPGSLPRPTPAFARPPYELAPGQVPLMSPGLTPAFSGSHRRQQASRSLVKSEVLW